MVVCFCIAVKLDLVYGVVARWKSSEQCIGAAVGISSWRQAIEWGCGRDGWKLFVRRGIVRMEGNDL